MKTQWMIDCIGTRKALSERPKRFQFRLCISSTESTDEGENRGTWPENEVLF